MALIDDEELALQYTAGLTIAELAVLAGMSKEWTRKRLKKLGCARRPRGPARVFNPSAEELRNLYTTQTLREIADHYGVGETAVWNRMKEFGIALEGKPFGHRGLPGRQRPAEWSANNGKARRGKYAGENSPGWKGGIHIQNLKARWTPEYKEWKKAALALHGAACQACGVKQGTVCECCGHKIVLHIHHVHSFAKYPDKRYDPSNSEVLCPKCHAVSHGRKSGELLESP